MPGYLERLLNGEAPVKKDKKNLKVDELLFKDENGNFTRHIKGVIQTKESIQFYLQKLKEIIEEKSEKLKGYQNDLTHTNLIIHDKENYIAEIKMNEFYSIFFTEEITKEILQSDFHEIYLLTMIGSDLYLFSVEGDLFSGTIPAVFQFSFPKKY